MTSGSETPRTRTSRACLEDAAAAAVSARSRLVGRGELLRSVRSGPTTVPSRGAARTWETSLGAVPGRRGAGRAAVQAMLLDVASDPVGHQVLDGGAAGHSAANVAGGDGQGRDVHAVDPAGGARHLVDQAVEVEAGPGGGGQAGRGRRRAGWR